MSIVDGKTILITGGTGSFGSTMLRYLLTKDVKEVRILSRDEKKQEDLRVQLKDHRLSMRLGCVRDSDAVERSVDGADYVFHAAALKQVPSCEFFPIEAVKTNILGSNNDRSFSISIKISSEQIQSLSLSSLCFSLIDSLDIASDIILTNNTCAPVLFIKTISPVSKLLLMYFDT